MVIEAGMTLPSFATSVNYLGLDSVKLDPDISHSKYSDDSGDHQDDSGNQFASRFYNIARVSGPAR